MGFPARVIRRDGCVSGSVGAENVDHAEKPYQAAEDRHDPQASEAIGVSEHVVSEGGDSGGA